MKKSKFKFVGAECSRRSYKDGSDIRLCWQKNRRRWIISHKGSAASEDPRNYESIVLGADAMRDLARMYMKAKTSAGQMCRGERDE